MARISVTQNINLQFDSVTMIPLVRGVNDVEEILAKLPAAKLTVAHVLRHPYLQAHMKAGSASIVPDPADPEDLALAAEEIARKRRAEADAWRKLKDDEEAANAQKVAAIAAASGDENPAASATAAPLPAEQPEPQPAPAAEAPAVAAEAQPAAEPAATEPAPAAEASAPAAAQ